MPWVTNAHTHYLHSFFSEGLFAFCKNEPVKMNEWMGVHLMMLCVCACGVLGEGVEDVPFIDLLLQLQNISHYCHLWGLQFLSTWAPADLQSKLAPTFHKDSDFLTSVSNFTVIALYMPFILRIAFEIFHSLIDPFSSFYSFNFYLFIKFSSS